MIVNLIKRFWLSRYGLLLPLVVIGVLGTSSLFIFDAWDNVSTIRLAMLGSFMLTTLIWLRVSSRKNA
ncbi:MAG: hypothetical protein COC07_04785 [Erythrobacteraceae bacterium]|nr:hypothetical protein [Qipengyuania citrea]PCH78120.1 MAG: hypothetical protein COC07_04785 [Erythrobacteraceae bacterium]